MPAKYIKEFLQFISDKAVLNRELLESRQLLPKLSSNDLTTLRIFLKYLHNYVLFGLLQKPREFAFSGLIWLRSGSPHIARRRMFLLWIVEI